MRPRRRHLPVVASGHAVLAHWFLVHRIVNSIAFFPPAYDAPDAIWVVVAVVNWHAHYGIHDRTTTCTRNPHIFDYEDRAAVGVLDAVPLTKRLRFRTFGVTVLRYNGG